MSCKYDIIDEGGRKRVRALRPFTVQGRDVCPMELGGYVYDDKTLSQEGNCWIFSGSLEYPGVRVMDEAIVDMGNNLPKNNARPKATIISGNSRIMGAISFETGVSEVAQTPAMFEQGSYKTEAGNVPIKITGPTRVRISVPIFGGTVGKVAITSTAYRARLISLNEAGIVVSATAWTVGGPAVTLTSTAPYILVEVRKVDDAAIAPVDVTAAGVIITQARGSSVHIFNSSIVSVYTGAVADVSNILRYMVSGTSASPTKSVVQNSYIRVECVFNNQNTFLANADFIKVNYNLALTGGVNHHLSGVFRNTNINTPASVSEVYVMKGLFDVSDCPDFEFSTVTFPDLAAMITSGKTFYFKNCNMPVGSAIHYYDPKVNVWDNIDFTKAMADLGKTIASNANIMLVSSNKQGLYRLLGVTTKSLGALIEALSSVNAANFGALGDSYDTVIYKDLTITGTYYLKGRNIFGGTLGGASQLVNKTGKAIEIDGSFRIEGNAQVTDTPLKGTGYIGGNAELKNGVVVGYIYMDGNAKYIPASIENPQSIRSLVMRGNAQVLKQGANRSFAGAMFGNSKINAVVSINLGSLMMTDDAVIERADDVTALIVYGECSMRDKASITGTGVVVVHGDVDLVGGFNLSAGSRTIYGKQVISSPDDANRQELPPTKTTW